MSDTEEVLINGQALHSNEQPPMDNELKGIGGWLILVIIRYIVLIISACSLILTMYNYILMEL